MKKGVQKRQNSDEEGRTEPEPHLLEISLRESAHGFESHPLRQNTALEAILGRFFLRKDQDKSGFIGMFISHINRH